MAKKTNLVRADYDGQEVQFTPAAWIDATAAAKRFNKRPNDWLDLPSTKEYIAGLDADLNTGKSGIWFRTMRGKNGGTWLHPELAVELARWLDVRFAIWCNRQIRLLLTGNHPHFEHVLLRHATAASNKYLRAMVERVRDADGKETKAHHYINECLLVNFVVCGEFVSIDRDALPMKVLDFLAEAEGYSAMLYARGKSREDRIKMLIKFKQKWIDKNGELPAIAHADQPKLEARTIGKQLAATPKRMRLDLREQAERDNALR
ncbi:hypothetical protein P3T18_005394 [Paraburkholderia sp. GAS199]|uniref:KilA-N domain-containing protein n=1 Tax=Paraburkholderia sp. GAS199 TaxID=3035126 RepID=UPI003D23C1F0